MPGFRRSWRGWAVIAAVLLGATLVRALMPPAPPLTGHASAVDGDTIRLGGERVRLLGLDAPELAQTCADPAGAEWACGAAARAAMSKLVGGGEVACAPERRDRYGRVLARCTAGKLDLAAALVGDGLAIADGGYFGEEAAARGSRQGIWYGSFVPPAEWRRQRQGEQAPSFFEVVRSWFR